MTDDMNNSTDNRHWPVKYRPTSLQSMVLPPSIKDRVKKHIEKRDRNTFLISGETGMGKTTLARMLGFGFARIPYTGTSEDDDARNSIAEINAANSRSIDDMRKMLQAARFLPPKADGRRVFIIDEIHALTGAAASALLKDLEEPHKHNVWILATNQPRLLLPEIRNRCTQIHIQNLSLEDLQKRLLDILRLEEVLQDWSRTDQMRLIEACVAAADEVPRAAIQLLQDAVSSNGEFDVNSMIAQLADRSTALEARKAASVIVLGILAASEGRDAIEAMMSTVITQDPNLLLDQLHVVTTALIIQGTTGQKQTAAYTFNAISSGKLQALDLKHTGVILRHLVRARAAIVDTLTDARGPLVNALLSAQKELRRGAAKKAASQSNRRDKAA